MVKANTCRRKLEPIYQNDHLGFQTWTTKKRKNSTRGEIVKVVALTTYCPPSAPKVVLTSTIVLDPIGVIKRLNWSSPLDLPWPQRGIVLVLNPEVEILEGTLRVSCIPGIPTLIFLASGPHTPRENRMSTSEEDCSYLESLTDKALDEELSTLAYYTR